MMAWFRRGSVFLLSTFALALRCSAFEADDRISLTFSIWSPSSVNFDLVEERVDAALRSFLCGEAKMVLLDTNFFGVCDNGSSTWSMENFIKNANTLFSYLLDEPTNVLISNAYETNENTLGTTWDVEYDVLRIGTIVTRRANEANATNAVAFLEQNLQERLDLSIVEGLMNQRFVGTVIVMDTFDEEIGTPSSESEAENTVEDDGGDGAELNDQEIEVLPETTPVIEEEDMDDEPTSNNEEADEDIDVMLERPELESDAEKPSEAFVVVPGRVPMFDVREHAVAKEIGSDVENSSSFTARGMNDAPELDYAESALVLRYIGIGMVGLTFVVHTILVCMGMCYKRSKERKEVSDLDPEYQRGLITEQGVNLMLERGRQQSEMTA